MAKENNGIVKISDWAKALAADNDGTTYTFDHAEIGTLSHGTAITSLMVKSSTETQTASYQDDSYNEVSKDVTVTVYKLYYTTDANVTADSNWMEYKDPNSGNNRNNADVWMIYTSGSVTADNSFVFHHVDESGNKVNADTTQALSVNGTGTYTIGANSGYAPNEDLKTNNTGKQSNGYWERTTLTKPTDPTNLPDNVYQVIYSNDSGHRTTTTKANADESGTVHEGKIGEYWYIYKNIHGITVHHVDSNGKKIADDTYTYAKSGVAFNAESQKKSDLTGYTYNSAHIGDYRGSEFSTITYTYDSSNHTWSNVAKNGETAVDTNAVINEITLVYSGSRSDTLNIYYKYEDATGSHSADAYFKDKDNTYKSSTTKTISSEKTNYLVADPTQYGAYADNIQYNNVWKTNTGETQLTYSSSHLGSINGPEISYVTVNSNGGLVYHTEMNQTAEPDNHSRNVTSWTASQPTGTQKGRSITITKNNDGSLTLNDTQNGSFPLNLVNDSAESDEDSKAKINASYTATYQGENLSVEYVVTEGTLTVTPTNEEPYEIPDYSVTVKDSFSSTQKNIYQVYTDKVEGGNVWIQDDMKYSGLFRANISDDLDTALRQAAPRKDTEGNDIAGSHDYSYEWYKVVTPQGKTVPNSPLDNDVSTGDNTITKVERKQSGEHWNLAYDVNDATWLDIEAEEGTDTWQYSDGQISFYVKVTYKDKQGTEHIVRSAPVKVQYYGLLENGKFDNPTIEGTSKYSWNGSNTNAINGYFANSSSASNYSDQFVWKTTQPGINDAVNKDIEVVNTASTQTGNNSWKHAYVWTSAGNWNSYRDGGADSGNQFAELNAEAAGALYQDVITHPNETLSYKLAHRARRDTTQGGDPVSTTPYDSMYLVIMPTKLAMTLGNNNSELATQTELQNFIESHGGYDTDRATGEEDKITYRDDINGILIRKISSDDADWHKISATNGYTAKGGLTRFFFVAGRTASSRTDGRDNTIGNFLDSVEFDQNLPTPEGFNLVVNKTFSGLTEDQIASMANDKSNPFTITVTNTYNSQQGTSASNDALQNAKLQFSAVKSGPNSYTFTATATQWEHNTAASGVTAVWTPITEEEYKSHEGDDNYRTVNLLSGEGNTGEVRTNTDGSVTFTWTFTEQSLPSNASDQGIIYSVTESNDSVAGYTRYATSSYTVNRRDGHGMSDPQTGTSATIRQNYEADFTLNNVYRRDHIIIRKTFSGITPSTVNEMKTGVTKNGKNYSPYQITVIKGSGSSAESKVLKLTGAQADGVTLNESRSDTGSSTFTWSIDGWGAGSYTLKEENFDSPDSNKLQQIKVDDNEIEGSPTWKDQSKTIGDSINITYESETALSDVQSGKAITGKNLVIGAYTVQPANDAGTKEAAVTRYLVWTQNEMGSRERTNILAKINEKWSGGTTATINNTIFINGTSVASTVVPDGDESYQAYDGSVTFTNGSSNDTKWSKYYSANITVNPDVKLENIYDPLVKIQKVDAKNADTKLSGAKFRLYKVDAGKKLYFISRAKDGSVTWEESSDRSTPKEFETDKDGIVNIGFLPKEKDTNNKYKDTTYYLEEITSPDGYNKLALPMSFTVKTDGTVVLDTTTVNQDGSVTVTKKNDGTVDNRVADITFPDPYYMITVQNGAGYSLPETGGRGTMIFTILGLFLFAGGGLILLGIKNRKRGDAHR